jgi:acyl-CoA synthetase (AMP-forming)/AMP-acid ligase II
MIMIETLGELIERNEAYYPDSVAFVMDLQRLTYAMYADRVRRLASALFRLGVRRQDRVGILSTNRIEYFEAYGACEWAGYILALYNFRLAPPEFGRLFEDSAPTVVIFEVQYSATVDGLRARFPGIKHYLCVGGPPPEWAHSYEALVSSGDPAGSLLRAQPNDYCYLYYTSGSTGKPKGVPCTQRAALGLAKYNGRLLGAGMRVLQITPAFHTGGKGAPLGALWLAGTVVLQRSFDALKFLEVVREERITFTFMVAPMIQAVIDHPRFGEFDVSSLRLIMSASAPIPVPLLKRAIDAIGPIFFIAYGATETGTICQLDQYELRPNGTPEDIKRLGSVGHVIPEAEGMILDEEGMECIPGAVGEVCFKSPIFSCYWNDSVATLEAMRGGWFHTGDLGYADERGYVFLVDRKKDVIISGGENIYSREVEDAIYRNPAVLEVGVIGIPDDKWGEAVKAVVLLRPGQTLTKAELDAHCLTQIARYKCPKHIDFVAELPHLGNGKLDKVSLRKQHRPA